MIAAVDVLQERFVKLDDFLLRNATVWKAQHRFLQAAPWESEFVHLSQWLRGLSPEVIEQYEKTPEKIPGCPSILTEWLQVSASLCQLQPFPRASLPLQEGDEYGIPQRKWRQIISFSASIAPYLQSSEQLVDCCSGKAHLGRTLGRWYQQEVLAIEQQAKLCSDGLQLAKEQSVSMKYIQTDLLAYQSKLPSNCSVVALHACGDLSPAVISLAGTSQAQCFAVAPCCFHRIVGDAYKPISRLARTSSLRFSKRDLWLPSSFECTARPRRRELRRTELAYRCGLDLLLREATGKDVYTTLPSVPRSLVAAGFVAFCRHLQQQQGFSLPPNWDPVEAEKAGWRRAFIARSLAMVLLPFRRAVELWINLDRALWAIEQGFSVQIGLFCSLNRTPRNILLLGTKN